MLVLGLARGDLDWRNIVNPKTKPLPLDISLHIPYNRLRSNRYDGA